METQSNRLSDPELYALAANFVPYSNQCIETEGTTIESSAFVVVFYGRFNAVIPRDKNGLQKTDLHLMESHSDLGIFIDPMLLRIQAVLQTQNDLPQCIEDAPIPAARSNQLSLKTP